MGQGASQMPWTPVLAAPPLRLADGLQCSGWRLVPRSEGGAQAGSLRVWTAVAALGLQTSEWLLSRASQVSRAPRGSAQTPASFWEPCLPSHPLCLPNPAFQVIAPCHRPLPPSHTLWWWGTEDGLWARLTLLPGSGFFSREMSFISGQQHRPWGEGPLGICRGAVCGPADHPHAVDLEAQVRCAGLLVGLRLCI